MVTHNEMIHQFFIDGEQSDGFHSEEVLQKIIAYLQTSSQRGGPLDPRPEYEDETRAEELVRLYGATAMRFLEIGMPFTGTELLLNGWDYLNGLQLQEKVKTYKAGLTIWFSMLYEKLNDQGAMFYWSILTHGDDYLVGHRVGEGMQRVRNRLGMSAQALEQFNHLIEPMHGRARKHDSWALSSGFPEDAIVKFAITHPEHSHLFALPTSLLEFPVNQAYLRALLANTDAHHKTTTAIGNALETLAAYLVMLMPGLTPRRNVRSETQDGEHDLVVHNSHLSPTVDTETFGRSFLIECKNWSTPIGVSEVGYFLYRMRLSHTKFGAIFSRNGITGQDKDRAADSLIRRAYHEDNAICVVVTQQHLEQIAKRENSLRSILLEGARAIQFGRSKN
ncbi:MAG: hypothetical protein IPM16_19470 [Chloroflexi bacterium]|nr:hypothetical protein [Chloroflexota bacterium]